jgi:hypothetical protein
MKITPSKSQPNTVVVRMEFEWLNDAAPQTNGMKSRRLDTQGSPLLAK